MTEFTISRLHTEQGIFRLSGLWQAASQATPELTVTRIEIMSTDGWALLDQDNDKVRELIADLQPVLHDHLLRKYKV